MKKYQDLTESEIIREMISCVKRKEPARCTGKKICPKFQNNYGANLKKLMSRGKPYRSHAMGCIL